jgi:hypothetical protein
MKVPRCLGGLAVVAASMATAAAAEPPSWPGLTCTVVGQSVAGTVRLQVRFDNQGPAAVELPPLPHLVLYADRGATEALDTTARLDRVQRTPLTVPAGGSRTELLAVDPALAETLRCRAPRPAAAALYFYRFSQRPQSRCLLEGYDAAALASTDPPCPGAGLADRSNRP